MLKLEKQESRVRNRHDRASKGDTDEPSMSISRIKLKFANRSTSSLRSTLILLKLNKFLCDVNGYRSITMFMIDEYSIENLLFLTQWSQIKELVRISGVLNGHDGGR